MIDNMDMILAQAAVAPKWAYWLLALFGSGVLTVVGVGYKHVTNYSKHMNGKKFVSQDKFDGFVALSEERHNNIIERLDRILGD